MGWLLQVAAGNPIALVQTTEPINRPPWVDLLTNPLAILIAVVVVLALLASGVSSRRRRRALNGYYGVLREIGRDPRNAELRTKALRFGRRYSDYMEPAQRAEFEVSMMNDINAAAAAGITKVEVTNVGALSGKTVAQQIEELGKLFLAGVITAEEFERGKALFLGAPVDKAASAVELLRNLHHMKVQGVLSESEFNAKKWEILSERLLPGKVTAARL